MVNEVHISYMTPEELAADQKRREKEKKKYPWRRNRQYMQRIIEHNVSTRDTLKRRYRRKK